MAYKSTGKAAKSASGASMSKYDVEVESRLQALEKVAHPIPTGATQQKVDDRLDALEKKVQELQTHTSVVSSGGADPRVDKIITHLAKKENIDDLF